MSYFGSLTIRTTVVAVALAMNSFPANAANNQSEASPQSASEIPEARYRKLHALQGHWNDVVDVEFSKNGKYAATASDDGSLIVWKTRDGSQKFDIKFGTGSNVTSATFSPDSKYIFTGLYDQDRKGKGVQLSVKKGDTEYVASLPGVVEMDYSPDGESLLVGYLNGTTPLSIINIERAKKGKKKRRIVHLEGHTGMHTTAEFSPDGKSALTTSLDDNMVVWNTESGRRKFGVKVDAQDATFSPNGQYIAATTFAGLNLYNAKNGELVRTLFKGTDDSLSEYELFFDLDFHPNGQILAAASSNGSIFFFDVNTGRTVSKISNAHSDQIRTIDYSSDGAMLISGSMDDTAIIWQLN